ncbi:unnamed protein product, partial [Heterosigma akashiwo]
MLGLGSWIFALSFFLATNFVRGPWPAWILLAPSRNVLILAHALSSMLFGGTVIISTIIEWLVSRSKSPAVIRFWFLKVSILDRAIALPALTGSIVSGVASATQMYGGFACSPKYVRGMLHALATFGVWWALTDLTTQEAARHEVLKWCKAIEEKAGGGEGVKIPRVVHKRTWSNMVSCFLVVTLYAVMSLKPGGG